MYINFKNVIIMKLEISAIEYGTVNTTAVNTKIVERLKKSIDNSGLINPITVTSTYQLVSGVQRLEACKSLGHTEIECTVLEDKTPIEIELIQIDENLMRKKLTRLELGIQLRRRKVIYEQLYPETKKGTNQFTRALLGTGYPIHESFVDNTAKNLGLSKSTVKEIIHTDKNILDEVKELIKDDKIADQSTKLIEISKMPKEEQLEKAKYLLEDPNDDTNEVKNRFFSFSDIRNTIQPDSGDVKKYDIINIAPDYATIPHWTLTSLKIPAAKNSVLFFWATQKQIMYSFDIIKKYGFQYQYTLTWNASKEDQETPVIKNNEFCLVCYKGNPCTDIINESGLLTESGIIYGSVKGKQSKPDAFYELVEKYLVGEKLDYLSHDDRQGWDSIVAEKVTAFNND